MVVSLFNYFYFVNPKNLFFIGFLLLLPKASISEQKEEKKWSLLFYRSYIENMQTTEHATYEIDHYTIHANQLISSQHMRYALSYYSTILKVSKKSWQKRLIQITDARTSSSLDQPYLSDLINLTIHIYRPIGEQTCFSRADGKRLLPQQERYLSLFFPPITEHTIDEVFDPATSLSPGEIQEIPLSRLQRYLTPLFPSESLMSPAFRGSIKLIKVTTENQQPYLHMVGMIHHLYPETHHLFNPRESQHSFSIVFGGIFPAPSSFPPVRFYRSIFQESSQKGGLVKFRQSILNTLTVQYHSR